MDLIFNRFIFLYTNVQDYTITVRPLSNFRVFCMYSIGNYRKSIDETKPKLSLIFPPLLFFPKKACVKILSYAKYYKNEC